MSGRIFLANVSVILQKTQANDRRGLDGKVLSEIAIKGKAEVMANTINGFCGDIGHLKIET
jgi:hypothetical protein